MAGEGFQAGPQVTALPDTAVTNLASRLFQLSGPFPR